MTRAPRPSAIAPAALRVRHGLRTTGCAWRMLAFALGCAAFPLFAQEFSGVKLELTAKDYLYLTGPAWCPSENYLIVSDLAGDRLLKWAPGHEAEIFRADAHGPAGNAFDSHDRLYTCETRARRVTRTLKNAQVETLASDWQGKKFNAPSGIVAARNGDVYFTDPAFGSQQDHRELDFYGIYRIPAKGPLQLAAKWTTRPNGIALSPNNKIVYIAAPDEHAIRAYDIERDGSLANERIVASKIAGVPAGIRVAENGDIFVAAEGIQVFRPDGKLAGTIAVHGRPSNCAFGFPDAETLFVTAGGNLYRAKMDLKGIF